MNIFTINFVYLNKENTKKITILYNKIKVLFLFYEKNFFTTCFKEKELIELLELKR